MSHLLAQANDRLAALENLRSALKIQYKKEKQALHQQYEQNNADLRRQITNLYNEIVFLQEAYHTEDCTSPEADQIEAAHDAVQIKAEQIKTEDSEPIEAEANEAEQTEADEAERIEAVKIEANEAAHIDAYDAEQIEADEADQIEAEQIEAAQSEAEQIEADEADEAEQIETDEATQNEAKQIETDEATQNAAKQIEADEAEHVAEHVAEQIDDPDELDDVALTKPIGSKHKHCNSEPDEPVAVESHPKHDEPVAVVSPPELDEPVARVFVLKRPLLRRIPLQASQSQSEPQEQVIRLNSGMLKRPMLQSKVEAPMPKAMPKVMPKAMPSQWQSIEQKALNRSPPKKRKLTSPSRPPLSPAPRRKRSPVPPREPPPAHLLPGFKLPSGYTCCPPSCRCQG